MNLLVPLPVTTSDVATQFEVFKFAFCCKMKPVQSEGHETITNALDRAMLRESGKESP